jgi:hypothetical protein
MQARAKARVGVKVRREWTDERTGLGAYSSSHHAAV